MFQLKSNVCDSNFQFDDEFKRLVRQQNRAHRIKERMIVDAVQLVLKWREISDRSSLSKITLKEGAEIVGVAKKSLDDYLLQFRLGRKYGFDFTKHVNSKIGVLRTFNKRMKKIHKEGKFSAGRKRKEDEENYTSMIIKILQEMNATPQTNSIESDLNDSKLSEKIDPSHVQDYDIKKDSSPSDSYRNDIFITPNSQEPEAPEN